MEPIRKEFETKENKELLARAYPIEKLKKTPGGASKAAPEVMSPNRLDIRVGKIISIEKVSIINIIMS